MNNYLFYAGIGLLCFFIFNIISYFAYELYKRRKHDNGNNNAGNTANSGGIASEKEGQASGQQEQKEA